MPYLIESHPIVSEKVKDPEKTKQVIKFLTEYWVSNNIFCPICGSVLKQHKLDKPINDLFCIKCKNDFELKSKKGKIGKKLAGGAYEKAIKQMENKPMHLFVLSYLKDFTINDFMVVPSYFFTKDIIIKRPKSLKGRKNYFMYDIDFSAIPETGKIYYIKNRCYATKTEVLENWNKVKFLEKTEQKSKGWIFDIMICIEKINKKKFSLEDIYKFEDELKNKYSNNHHIQDKIRQQLQFLRDKGYLEFIGRGKYRLL